ncbi:polysaccharide deacetylase family protein [Oceanotoga sp. DSM 15011]|uniref:polysaccharide deacetylase family protein n=1 Tax=Oceanotoga sp. DSM 15011 TaxID=2984951 RepID=UPI0021F3E5DF|nr:polysaccharide deacetylase family protein [Oceanotoga sp. DSM 15011]UYP00774.1 polysaccharide deacetylase family protein [Oceanotoga sp. DSM 15011]
MKKNLLIFAIVLISLISFSEVYVILYHRFNDDRYPSTSTSTEDIEMHLNYFKDNNYKMLTPEEFQDYIDKKIDIEKGVLITIDDGYKTTKYAYDLFKKYNIPFMLFINTDNVGYPDYLTWEQLSQMNKDDIVTLGSHSAKHDNFVYMLKTKGKEFTLKFFEDDLKKSIKTFQDNIKFTPKHYAYPYGYYTTGMDKILEENGISYAFSMDYGPFIPEYSKYYIPREPLTEDWAYKPHLNYVMNRKALKVKDIYPEEIPIDEEFKISASVDLNFHNPILYISQEGIIPNYVKDDNIYSKDSYKIKKDNNKIALFLRDENNIEHVKYWLLRPIKELN